jgi:hypothetical protein
MEDLTGLKFGLLTVVKPSSRPPTKNGWIFWECRCDCGGTHVAASGHLKNGHIKSCGCLTRRKKWTKSK